MPPMTLIDWSCDHPCKCWYNTLSFGPFPVFWGGSEGIPCIRSWSVVICGRYECQKPIMFAAVVTRVTPSEGLLNGNTLLPYYPQLHGNNVANNAFYCLVKRRWGKAGVLRAVERDAVKRWNSENARIHRNHFTVTTKLALADIWRRISRELNGMVERRVVELLMELSSCTSLQNVREASPPCPSIHAGLCNWSWSYSRQHANS